MKRVAITGGIAEGKSTVLGYLAEMGFAVASADKVAREVLLSEDVQKSLGALLTVDGEVTPELLRSRLDSEVTRRRVNAITHPLILAKLRASQATFFEIPLLLETCLQSEFDRVWVVSCGQEEQLRRLAQRVPEIEHVERLIGMQLTSRVKIAFADRVIRTNQPEPAVQRLVTVAVQRDLS